MTMILNQIPYNMHYYHHWLKWQGVSEWGLGKRRHNYQGVGNKEGVCPSQLTREFRGAAESQFGAFSLE